MWQIDVALLVSIEIYAFMREMFIQQFENFAIDLKKKSPYIRLFLKLLYRHFLHKWISRYIVHIQLQYNILFINNAEESHIQRAINYESNLTGYSFSFLRLFQGYSFSNVIFMFSINFGIFW